MTRTLAILAALAATAWAGGTGWESDFDKALKKAEKRGQLVIVEFTEGDKSDALNKNVFYKSKFKAWAKKNVVLAEIDFSKRVSSRRAEQYAELKKKYEIENLPAVLLVDATGKRLDELKAGDEPELEKWLANAGDAIAAASGAGEWLTDWDKAKKIARRTKKPMLVAFDGSDW